MNLLMIRYLTVILVLANSFIVQAKVILFDDEAVLNAKLEFDISYFREHKEELREEGVPGKLLVDGKEFFVEVLSRGHGSMDNEHPPFKLNFKKKEVKGTLFEDINKIKAFASPDGLSNQGEKYVLSNYLTYKLHERIFPISFKTRLFKITYHDTSNGMKEFSSFTFLMEPNKNLAKRLNLEYIEFDGINNDPIQMDIKSKLDPTTKGLMTSFQFILGNWDHAIPGIYSDMFKGPSLMEKNMKMFKDQNGKYFPVGYDFDMSGFLDHQICFFEIGYGMLKRTSHYELLNPNGICNKKYMLKHFQEDLKDYHYQTEVFTYSPIIINEIEKWKLDYENELQEMNNGHFIDNLEKYLEVLKSSL